MKHTCRRSENQGSGLASRMRTQWKLKPYRCTSAPLTRLHSNAATTPASHPQGCLQTSHFLLYAADQIFCLHKQVVSLVRLRLYRGPERRTGWENWLTRHISVADPVWHVPHQLFRILSGTSSSHSMLNLSLLGACRIHMLVVEDRSSMRLIESALVISIQVAR